jgi:hypothetical protein
MPIRSRWAVFATLFLLTAFVTQSVAHPLAGLLFDIQSDLWGIGGVLLLALMPVLNERALATNRHLALARAATGGTFVFGLLLLALMGPAMVLGVLFSVFTAVVPPLVFAPAVMIWQAIVLGQALRDPARRTAAQSSLPRTLCVVVSSLVMGFGTLYVSAALRDPRWLGCAILPILSVLTEGALRRGRHLPAAFAAIVGVLVVAIGLVATWIPSVFIVTLPVLVWAPLVAEYDMRLLAYRRSPSYPTDLARGESLRSLSTWFSRRSVDVTDARRVYFLMTGRPYTSAEPPHIGARPEPDGLYAARGHVGTAGDDGIGYHGQAQRPRDGTCSQRAPGRRLSLLLGQSGRIDRAVQLPREAGRDRGRSVRSGGDRHGGAAGDDRGARSGARGLARAVRELGRPDAVTGLGRARWTLTLPPGGKACVTLATTWHYFTR